MKSDTLLRRTEHFILFLCFVLLLGTVKAQTTAIKFTVDMKYQIADGSFNTGTDKVFLRGSFNSWDLSAQMNHEGNGVYTITLNLNAESYYDYKYFTDAPGFPNGGYEASVGIATNNRWMAIGANNIELAKIYFNNANIPARKVTAHFNIFSDEADIPNLDRIADYLERKFAKITGTLESTVAEKTNIWIFPDQKTYFVYKGYPDSPSWSIGGAVGKTDVLLFSPTYMGWECLLSTALHEFTHIVVAWKIAGTVPSWLNEGCALIFSEEPPARPIDRIRDIVNNILGGVKPPLSYIEQESFGDGNGYPLSHTTVDFILTRFGSHKLAEFLVNIDYSVLGYSSKAEFQTEWHAFLDQYYLASQVSLKFYLDMGYYISKGLFNSSTDEVMIGGTFSGWYPYGTVSEGDGIYSFTITSPYNSSYEYKYKISTAGAANNGWETNSRTLQVLNTGITLPLYPFNNIDNRIIILSPDGGEFLIAGDNAEIKWKYNTVPAVKIEISTDNGNTWSEVANTVASTFSYNWRVPYTAADQAKIKITDISDNSNNDISANTFKIVQPAAGGPYQNDQNSVLLMHFDNNYNNKPQQSNPGTAYNAVSFTLPALSALGMAANIDNSNGGTCIKVPHYSALDLSASWTIECWYYLNNIGTGSATYPNLILKGWPSDYSIYFSADGSIATAEYTTTTGGSRNVSVNGLDKRRWYHLSFIKDLSRKTLSLIIRDINKNIVGSSVIFDDAYLKNTVSDLAIGGVTGGSNIQFDGYIDELRISSIVRDFTVGIEDETAETIIPNSFELMQNYPNPFNPVTTIKFSLPSHQENVLLKIYDTLGREVANLLNGAKQAGTYSVKFDASNLPSGVYFYRLQAGGFSRTVKMILLK